MNTIFFNLTKRKKRDILSELLVDKSPEGIISKKEINAVNRIIKTSSSSRTAVSIKNQLTQAEKSAAVRKRNSEPKRKKTHYLSREISESLDKAQVSIRSRVPEKLRSRVSKSHIVNQALAMILQDFGSKGNNSMLMRTILQKL